MFGAESLTLLRRRAERAAAAGEPSFSIPEAAPVAERVATMVALDPLRTEAETWLARGASYHELVRLAARALMQSGPGRASSDAVYVPKAAGELEPLLRLWPAVLALPTMADLGSLELVAPFPVHPLGVVKEATWADGRLCSPPEYFFHDLDLEEESSEEAHVHRVLPPSDALERFHFGEAEWRRKGRDGWCYACSPPKTD